MGKRNRIHCLLAAALLAVGLGLAGCAGDDGDDGAAGANGADGQSAYQIALANGFTGTEQEWLDSLKGSDAQAPSAAESVEPESCAVCHSGAGDEHQAHYDQLYQDGVIEVANLAYENVGGNDVVTFDMSKNNAAFGCEEVDNLNIYWVAYTGTSFELDGGERLSIKGTLADDGNGGCTSTKAQSANGDLSTQDGVVVVYGYDEQVGSLPARIRQVKYPYAALEETGEGVGYASAANNEGCERCHSVPYLKHGNIYAEVGHEAANDFYTCKVCHLDNGDGGHFEWQLLVENPPLAAEYFARLEEDEDAAVAWLEEELGAGFAAYQYKTSLMNDVHRSHAMEFPYPQSMSNCVTCHEGKLESTLTADNFKGETCKSCHPETNLEGYASAVPPLDTIMPDYVSSHSSLDSNCSGCHIGGEGNPPAFSDIHSGYDKKIYSPAGTKYADAITVSISNAVLDGTDLTFEVSASGSVGDIDSADIVPAVMIGLYGYDTKDFIVNGHDRWDSNCNGTISRSDGDQPIGEYVVGAEVPGCPNPYWTLVAGGPGAGPWTFTAHLGTWADMIADGTIKKVELAVMPELEGADEELLGLNATSRTFDLAGEAFEDDFFGHAIVAVEKCNHCHDQLATTFHSGDRGGNITVCRMCHVTLSGGSHLEMQSRSIDSYVHAIHSFQAFDIGDIDFADPVEAMHYDHHIEFPYPTHGITDCESCHNEGTYNVPDQAKSLPGVFSASDSPLDGWDRNIGAVPSYVAGPASRACGACHRAELINEDRAGELASFNQHTKTFGYLVENTDGTVLDTVINKIMAMFK